MNITLHADTMLTENQKSNAQENSVTCTSTKCDLYLARRDLDGEDTWRP